MKIQNKWLWIIVIIITIGLLLYAIFCDTPNTSNILTVITGVLIGGAAMIFAAITVWQTKAYNEQSEKQRKFNQEENEKQQILDNLKEQRRNFENLVETYITNYTLGETLSNAYYDIIWLAFDDRSRMFTKIEHLKSIARRYCSNTKGKLYFLRRKLYDSNEFVEFKKELFENIYNLEQCIVQEVIKISTSQQVSHETKEVVTKVTNLEFVLYKSFITFLDGISKYIDKVISMSLDEIKISQMKNQEQNKIIIKEINTIQKKNKDKKENNT